MKACYAIKLALLIAVSGLLGGLSSGCAWSVGSGKGETHLYPTRGQELIDLKRAKDEGAITEQEYQSQKKRVMEK